MEMKVELQKEHEWLKQFEGEWVMEDMKAEGMPEEAKKKQEPWVERGRSLDGVWYIVEGNGAMPGGGRATTMMTVGYDAAKKRFVGTWLGTMMGHLWVYEGQLDASGRVLTMDTLGPKMGPEGPGEGMAPYQDITEFVGDDVRTLTSRMKGEDGQWHEFMKATYRRRK